MKDKSVEMFLLCIKLSLICMHSVFVMHNYHVFATFIMYGL